MPRFRRNRTEPLYVGDLRQIHVGIWPANASLDYLINGGDSRTKYRLIDLCTFSSLLTTSIQIRDPVALAGTYMKQGNVSLIRDITFRLLPAAEEISPGRSPFKASMSVGMIFQLQIIRFTKYYCACRVHTEQSHDTLKNYLSN